MQSKQVMYVDVSLFRPMTRLFPYYKKVEKFLDTEVPGLLDNSDILFTWSQLIEACDLGQIIKEIEKTDIWKQQIEGKKLIERFGFVEGLNVYFATAVKALSALPDLQKNELLKYVDKAISHTCAEAKLLVENTLQRYRDRIFANDYMPLLAEELAWAFLTAYPFIKSKDQWEKRKICYDSLMSLWHKLRKDGHDLVLFRLAERQYYSYLSHSPDLDFEGAKLRYEGVQTRQDLVKRIFKKSPLKQGGDLCDGEIIHFSYLGHQGLPVVGIAKGEQLQISQRLGIFDRCLMDLQSCVLGWNPQIIFGQVLSLDTAEDGETNHAYRNLPSNDIIAMYALGSEKNKDVSETPQTLL